MNNKRVMVLLASLLMVACDSTEYRSDQPLARVNPTKRYWVKSDTSIDDARIAGQDCSREIREDPRYMAAVNEAVDIGAKWMGNPPPEEKKRQIAARKASSDYYVACMQSKGYRFVPNGVPIK